jgi:PucR family transcriptional regulator, purine catabolism regulatory protein
MAVGVYSQPTVRLDKLIQHALPSGSYLVSGNPHTQISWARMLKSQSVTTSGPQPGELALVPSSTIRRLRDPGRELAKMIGALGQVKALAVGIQGLVDSQTLEAAAENNIAVISLPDDAEASQVERDIVRLIMDSQAQMEQRANELQDYLMRFAMGNRGLTAIVRALAQKVERTIIVYDRTGLTLARGFPEKGATRWERQIALLNDGEMVQGFEKYFNQHNSNSYWHQDDMLVAPMIVERQIVGYIATLIDAPVDDFDSIALLRGASVCSMELAKQRAVEVAMEKVRGDWVQVWLSNGPMEDPTIELRAERNGFLPTCLYAVVVFRWITTDENQRNNHKLQPEQMTEIVRQELRHRRIDGIVGQYVDRTVVLLPIDDAQHTLRMKQNTESLRQRLQDVATHGYVNSGVGRPRQGLRELRESFMEAEKALALSDQLWTNPRVTYFGDLSLYELLLGVTPDHLHTFSNSWLKDIIRYDDQHKSDLLITLDAYFNSNGNMRLTAKELNIHRNTLVYRLNRIAEITQLDMDDANVHLNLRLALKAYHLLRTFNL